MKKFHIKLDQYLDKLERHWKEIPIIKQRQYTLYAFLSYLLLTVGVIFKIWYDTGKSDKAIVIQRIENPILNTNKKSSTLQDTLLIFKHHHHERK